MTEIPPLFAHRGCSADAPENTIAAFRLAADREIPGIELDVQLSRDGEVVVIHDADLSRVAGIDSRVSELDRSELAKCDVGSWFSPAFASERIPLLDELFEEIGVAVFYDIELKTSLKSDDPLPAAVARIIRRHGLAERCMVSSFNPFAVRRFDDAIVPTSVIYSRSQSVPWILRRGAGCLLSRCAIAKPNWKQVSQVSIARHRLFGRVVSAWTVDEPEVAQRLFDLGVDAVISNAPALLFDTIPERLRNRE